MAVHRVTRRVAAALAVLTAVAGAFVVGVITAGRPPASAQASNLDEAAARIEDSSLTPVPRQSLDAAAITAMLRAADDPWGGWQPPAAGTATATPSPRPSVAVRRLSQPHGAVTVLTVSSFASGTGREVRAALATLPGDSEGVVLDLRGNGGGLLAEAVETASAFLDGGVVVRTTRRDGTVQEFDAVGDGDTTTPAVVLVDGGSASASEVVAGALLDRGRAVLVGSRTYGKGTVQEPSTLSDGSRLELTVASYTTPSGRDLDGAGLVPDIQVAAGSKPAVALARAVEVLPGLLADTGGRP